ncbi:hypothetical protein SAJA_07705 [Salinisphaera japonica YTM-1]|uniref:Uncharacterized protein n=1 Tax=Salinisphaera japonica YTM-1 TaxID=1209778 RepID=A0A423PSY6_9GAMM|nr:hypothetical protein SAJA_07705 [Salinisphaera japonica YTM-1]
MHAKLGASERLAERRDVMADRAWALIEQTVAPTFQAAAERIGEREFRMAGDTEWGVASCGIYGIGAVEQDPRVAFHEAEFDAYQPLVILRRKAEGAGAPVESRTVHVDNLDGETLDAFLAETPSAA